MHEAMDQIGAVTGPVIVSAVLFFRGNDYRTAFAVLAIPAVAAILIVLVTRFLYPDPSKLEVKKLTLETRGFSSRYWLYLLAVGCVAFGFADWALVSLHFQRTALFSPPFVPILYAIAMGVDAVAALVFGRLYDAMGPRSLAIAAGASALFAPLVFMGGASGAVIGAVLWGIGMGWQESIMRSVVADLTPKNKRASAFGVFNTGYGLFWFAGSALIGLLYERSIPAVVILSVASQLAAIPLYLMIARKKA
jgi:MFS family permease